MKMIELLRSHSWKKYQSGVLRCKLCKIKLHGPYKLSRKLTFWTLEFDDDYTGPHFYTFYPGDDCDPDLLHYHCKKRIIKMALK